MFVGIKSYILKFSKRPDISQSLEEQNIKKNWQEIVGSINKSARGKSEALYVNQRGELLVRAKDHLWLQELTFYKEDIKRAVSQNPSIKSVRLVV